MKINNREWTADQCYKELYQRVDSETRTRLRRRDQLHEYAYTARQYVTDAKKRYMQKKLKVKSMKQLEMADPFKDIAEYTSYSQIQNDYGYGCLSEKEFDRLTELFELRERQKELNKGKPEYEDEVTEMLDWCLKHIDDVFREELQELDEEDAILWEKAYKMAADHNRSLRERMMKSANI